MSGVFSIENASTDRKGLQQAVDRVVAIIAEIEELPVEEVEKLRAETRR